MLELRGIKRLKNGEAEAFYCPEGSEEIGYVKIDKNGDIIEERKTAFDKNSGGEGIYLFKARRKLKKLIDSGYSEDKYMFMWY